MMDKAKSADCSLPFREAGRHWKAYAGGALLMAAAGWALSRISK